jgi:hypothetical protein
MMKDEFPDRRDDERHDASRLIGLHKLAEQNGEGLVPELYQIVREREAARAKSDNVIAFSPRDEAVSSKPHRNETGRVIAFRR